MKQFNSLNYQFGMKVHIYLTPNQRTIVKCNSDIQRWYYNRQLTIDYYIRDMFEHYGANKLYFNPLFNKWLNDVQARRKTSYNKKIFSFLQDKRIDCMVPGRAFMHERTAKSNYRQGLQHHPRFHTKRRQGTTRNYQTSCYSYKRKSGRVFSVKIVDRKHIYIKKLGKIKTSKIPPRVWRMFKMNKLRIGTATIKRDNLGIYTISLQLGSDTPFVRLPKISCKLAMLGYDLNVSNFMMDSNHHVIDSPKYYEKAQHKLAWVQHTLSRKYRHNQNRDLTKCSNYQTNRLKLAKISKHVMNQRFNFLSNITKDLVDNQDFIVGESLESSNMLKNHRLAKSIQSVGWHEFIGMLAQKANEYNKIYILVNPRNTTQMCSRCGYICNYKDGTHLDLSKREWTCPRCGAHHIRDVNASINILYKGILAIQKYLPKKLRLPINQSTTITKTDLNFLRESTSAHPAWLRYLVTHYSGVIDSAKLNVSSLNTFQRV